MNYILQISQLVPYMSGVKISTKNWGSIGPIIDTLCNFFTNVAKTLQNKITDLPKIFDTNSQRFKDYYTGKGIIPKSRKFSHVTEDFVYK